MQGGNRGLELRGLPVTISGVKKLSLIALGLAALAGPAAGEQEKRPVIYPFDVTVGGQKATVQEGNMLFVVIEKPVKPDAVVAIEEESALFVINAFACEADGTVKQNGAPAAVVFKSNAKELKLSETLDKKPLAPGTYLMNVVAHNATSRVVFTVTDGKGEVKMPDFKKILEFLRKE